MKLLRQRFEDALGPDAARMVDISTIDGFQVLAVADYTHMQTLVVMGDISCQWWECWHILLRHLIMVYSSMASRCWQLLVFFGNRAHAKTQSCRCLKMLIYVHAESLTSGGCSFLKRPPQDHAVQLDCAIILSCQ